MADKTINIFWFNRYDNIGDLLGPWIVQKIAKNAIVRYSTYVTRLEAFKIVAGSLLHFRMPQVEFVKRLFTKGPILFSIGSILDHCNRYIVVWGAGFQNRGEVCDPGFFFAVRGLRSLERLCELGFQLPEKVAIGDPALLMPLLYSSKPKKVFKIGIVMHDSDREFVKENFREHHLIDVATKDIESFIDDLTSCERILTTSMHGLIIAHAYRIPALWIKKNWIGSDGFKFDDYYSSIQIPTQGPILADEIIGKSVEELFELFDSYISLPPEGVLEQLQKNLLNAAPFELKKDYCIQ